jgi:hypothetical protein
MMTSVFDEGAADLGVTELIQEDRKPVRQLGLRAERGASQCDERSRSSEDRFPIHGDEVSEHAKTSPAA